MRILQLGKYYFPYMGGIETHLKDLCQSLQNSCKVEVVVFNDRRTFSRESVAGVDVTRVPSLGRVASTEVSPSLVRELSARVYDVLHIHTPNPMGMAAYLLARKSKTHRLVVTHHSDTIRQARLRKVFEPVFARVMTRADLIITTSNRYLQTSAELAPYRDKAVVVPYGIDTRAFENVTESETKALREKYGAPLVLSVGRLIYYKGFDVLLEAMRRIDAKAIIIGSGPLRSQLEEQSRERGLDGRVRFLGDIHNDRLAPFFAAADVFVLPSVARSEAFGIVQIEAMAAGVPVINTMLDSGVPEVSIDGVTGLTVPPGDPSALALAIQRMLADRGLRNSFSTAGRARARMEFGLGTMVARVSALYGQLAASPSR